MVLRRNPKQDIRTVISEDLKVLIHESLRYSIQGEGYNVQIDSVDALATHLTVIPREGHARIFTITVKEVRTNRIQPK